MLFKRKANLGHISSFSWLSLSLKHLNTHTYWSEYIDGKSIFLHIESYVTLTVMNKDGEAFDKKKSRTKGGTLSPLYEDEVKFIFSTIVL